MRVFDGLSFSNGALNRYIREIKDNLDQDEDEGAYTPDLAALLKDFFDSDAYRVKAFSRRDIKIEGKPDITVKKNDIVILNIECKRPGADVDNWLRHDSGDRLHAQVFRYMGGVEAKIPVIITDFINIWVIDNDSENQEDADHVVKSKYQIIDDSGANWRLFSSAKANFEKALKYACKDIAISIQKIEGMITLLVKHAKEFRDKIVEVFNAPTHRMHAYFSNIRNDINSSIFSAGKDNNSREFADLLAQTLVYSSFVAWLRFCKEGNKSTDFTLAISKNYFPYESFSPFIFPDIQNISPDIRDTILNRIENIFKSTACERITEDTESLITTFYSSFLNKYDPKISKERGVVYTPAPIVEFMVKGIDYFLRKYFDRNIVSEDVKLLDPAAGTMAYPCEVLRFAKKYYKHLYPGQLDKINLSFNKWVHAKFLKNLRAFEILIAPYVLGYLRTGMVLKDLKAKFNPKEDNIQSYLFNTLMELQVSLDDSDAIFTDEIAKSLHIKDDQGITVVFGNPPYGGSKENEFSGILDKLKVYKQNIQREGRKAVSGITALKYDYVKFIRFAQWKVCEQETRGIVAFITNNHYLDGLTARGMRYSLQKDFDQIWIVDLHGNRRGDKGTGIPEHVRNTGITMDKNIFGKFTDVGVAIVFFIRTPDHSDDECEVHYIDKWGSKNDKLDFLSQEFESKDDMIQEEGVSQEEEDAQRPEKFLDKFVDVPRRLDFELKPDIYGIQYPELQEKYSRFTKFIDIFDENLMAIKTGHIHELMDMNQEETEQKIRDLFMKYRAPPDIRSVSWNPKKILKTNEEYSLNSIIKYAFRGFDVRYLAYDINLMQSHRFYIMQFLLPHQDNLSLVVNRQSRGVQGGTSYLVTDTIFDNMCNEGSSGAHAYAFPLKINKLIKTNGYKKDNYDNPFPAIDSNIKSEFKTSLSYGDDIANEEVFFYVYGILYSSTYRERYSFALKKEFPNIPFPSERDLFIKMSGLGKKLANFHLLRDSNIDGSPFTISESDDHRILYIRSSEKDKDGNHVPDTYDPRTQKIYFQKRKKSQVKAEQGGDNLNEIAWIGGITPEMWNFRIGGRQQLKLWLYERRYSEKPRKKHITRGLNVEEIEYFLKICHAIKLTIEILPDIDELYNLIDP